MKKFDSIVPASEKQPASAAGRAEKGTGIDSVIKNTVVGAFDGINAGIGELHEERTADRATAEISKQLYKLEILEEVQEALHPRFHAWGCRLEQAVALHPFGKPDYTYTALRSDGVEVALAQLPPGVFATDDTGYALYVSDFAKMLKAFRERRTRLFSQGIQGITFAFSTALDDERKDADWRFIPWDDVMDLQKAKIEFWQAFKVAELARAPGGSKPANRMKAPSNAQINLIVDVLVRLANDYDSSEIAFKTLVSSSNWPKEWKDLRLTGWKNSAEPDARTFVSYMTARSTFPPGHELVGRSVLGEFLRSILGRLGGPDVDILARIIVECALVPDASTYTKYYDH